MPLETLTPPRVLTIAGSDSGAGAGIQADLKTFAACGTFGTSAITALTAQNSLGVQGVLAVEPSFVAQQIESVVVDIGISAIKLGMLAGELTIIAIAETLQCLFASAKMPPLVLDPVAVSTSGHSLLPTPAVVSLIDHLFPLTTIITPNVAEARLLLQEHIPLTTVDHMRQGAVKLGALGAPWVLLKGGHMPMDKNGGRVVVDFLYDVQNKTEYLFERRFIVTKNTHGTGCTLSSAIAAFLAKGESVPNAVRLAGDYVAGAIASSYAVGAGAGPVNHFFNMHCRTLPLPTPSCPHPFTDYLIARNPDLWHKYVFHPFPIGLANGTMPLASFLHFICQDYHFLKQYARTHSLAAYKTEDMKEMGDSNAIVGVVVKETEMHIGYCEKYGISREQLMAVPESVTNVAYTRYVLDTSVKGDLLDLRVVTSPCLIGYGHVGARLLNATEGVDRSDKNPYWGWISEYGAEWYQQAVQTGIDLLESNLAASPISPKRLEELAGIFEKATELEVAFWDAAIAAGSQTNRP